jgi:hypothetical protein
MWKCKHCNNEFDFLSISEKANHSRWCDKNPARNSSNHLFVKGIENKFGKKSKYDVVCVTCQQQFQVVEREKLFPSKEKYFCSRNCANSVGGKVKAIKHYRSDDEVKYTTLAWRHHKKECIVCGENKIVAVHHYNENHNDNRPENLVPLCPTHHQYIHSKYKWVIKDIVDNYVNNFGR